MRPSIPSRPSLTVVLYLVALLLACACVVGGVFVVRTHEDRAATRAEQERYGDVVAAASREAEAFINIDYRDPDATFEAVAAGATGDFREQYASVTEDLIQLLTNSESVMTGEVSTAAVSNLDEDSARVIVSTQGSVSNTAISSEQEASARSFRLALELVKVEDEWLTNNLEFVG